LAVTPTKMKAKIGCT